MNEFTKQTEKQEKHLQESEEEIERLKIEEARVFIYLFYPFSDLLYLGMGKGII